MQNVFLDAASSPDRSRDRAAERSTRAVSSDGASDPRPGCQNRVDPVGRSVTASEQVDSTTRGARSVALPSPGAGTCSRGGGAAVARTFADARARLRWLGGRVFRAAGRVPAALPAVLLVLVAIAVATVLLVQRDGARAQRDHAWRQAASASQTVIGLRRTNRALVSDRDRARRRARDAARSSAVAAADARRWRRIAASRGRRAQRARDHR